MNCSSVPGRGCNTNCIETIVNLFNYTDYGLFSIFMSAWKIQLKVGMSQKLVDYVSDEKKYRSYILSIFVKESL